MNLSDEQIRRVAEASAKLKHWQELVSERETDLQEAQQIVKDLESQILPDMLDEFGLESLTLKDGTKLTVKPFVAAHISKEHEPEAFQWLQDHGYGDIIKERTVINVHPSTLKAWAKERVESGDNIPDDLFGVYVGRKAVLK